MIITSEKDMLQTTDFSFDNSQSAFANEEIMNNDFSIETPIQNVQIENTEPENEGSSEKIDIDWLDELM